jgi:hypothetical protein
MEGSFVLQILRNDLLTVIAMDGKVRLRPADRVTDKHRQLVRENKAALLAELAKWPASEVHPRALQGHGAQLPRRDELGREGDARKRGRQPRVITGRPAWRR